MKKRRRVRGQFPVKFLFEPRNIVSSYDVELSKKELVPGGGERVEERCLVSRKQEEDREAIEN